ncbi:MAG: hypothetical protein NW208_10890 [Bryobacter sp.]|nr:hypothetical protein [Bryobacter sp.]
MAGNAILLDANLLVLLLVGRIDARQIGTFKRTQAYDEKAFQLLNTLLSSFRQIVTTSHILTEASNLLDFQGKLRAVARDELAAFTQASLEVLQPSSEVVQQRTCTDLGLTDAAIRLASEGRDLVVLSDDLPLHLALERDGFQSFNFSYIRAQTR